MDYHKKEKKEHFFSTNYIALGESEDKTIEVEVLRVGTIRDRDLKITEKMLSDMVENHKKGVYGTELQMNIGHKREGEAGGWIKDLYLKGKSLMAKIEPTKLGIDKISNKLYKYVSAEFADRFPHHESGKIVDNVFIGLALTNVPALKGQSPIVLSEDIELNNYNDMSMFKQLLSEMKARAFVSKEDKEMLKKLSEELSDEEQKEVEPEMAEVEAMPEEAPEEEKPEGEEEKKEEAPESPEGGGEEAPKTEELAEKLNTVTTELAEKDARIKQLEEDANRTKLSEQFEKTMMLSEDKATGFRGEAKDGVVEFMLSLTDAQLDSFTKLMSEISHVDLNVYGGNGAVNTSTDKQEQIVELSERFLKEGKAKDITEAQKMAAAEVNKQ